ncbi:ABC transporter substrate-binding protein [Hornefia butyriciproducens]|uniref:ABC transporter substrate-binding protein n=1 Tax=Hornefia butyriciproducens TaxID=2652293 RepID=UPI003F891613
MKEKNTITAINHVPRCSRRCLGKKILTVLLIIGMITALSACGNTNTKSGTDASESGKTTVTLGYLPITHALAIFEEKELLEKENSDVRIKLQKFSSWSDLTDALNSGKIDGASVLIELAMKAKSQRIGLKAVALGHRDGNVLVVARDIRSAADLKGKKIAIPHTKSSHNILLQEALAKKGLTDKDVSIVQMSPAEMPSALSNGSIAGYCVAEPFGAQAVDKKFGKVLYYSEELWPDSFCCGLVLTDRFISDHPEQTETLIRVYKEAGNKLESGDTALKTAEKYLGQNESVLKTSLKWIHFDKLTITEGAYKQLSDRVKKYGINENPPSYKDFVYQTNGDDE